MSVRSDILCRPSKPNLMTSHERRRTMIGPTQTLIVNVVVFSFEGCQREGSKYGQCQAYLNL